MTLMHTEKAKALLTLLEWEFADGYAGTDDDMPDATNDWISGLLPEEVGDICQSVFQEGI